VLAAVAIQGPTVRITDDRLPELAALLDKTTRRIAPLLTAA
jgi:DNA-binding IclR family transcriptional regulator